jgi:HEAT repeat protein
VKGVPGQQNEGFLQMQSLPPDECRRIALRGLRHENWRVRRRCAQLLDDITLTDETIEALQAALRDEHPRVRHAALHSLVCEHCKPDGCALDVRTTAISMLSDPSPDVRAQAVAALWLIERDDLLDMLSDIAANDRSARVRKAAAGQVEWLEFRLSAEQAQRELPEELRRKTERHPGKWVGIADGKIVGAHRSWGQTRRSLRGVQHKESVVVFVPAYA